MRPTDARLATPRTTDAHQRLAPRIPTAPTFGMRVAWGPLLFLGCGATQAQAQIDSSPPNVPQRLEKVEVTGSRIRRIEGETALPVQIIGREQIERSGAQTVEELLGLISANFGNFKEALSIGDESRPGFSGASLRGLGDKATLVLLDGRRLSNYALSNEAGIGVDLHTIPLEAVERVEVLKDGASAIYGTDAIAGVINFILKKDYRGAEVSLYRGDSQAGGGGRSRATATLGIGDLAGDRYNVLAIVDYQKNDALAGRERSFAATGYRPGDNIDSTNSSSFPANIPFGRGFKNPAAPGCTDATVFKRGGCFLDTSKLIDILPPSEQSNVLARGTLQVAADHRLYAELLYTRNRSRFSIAPTPINVVTNNGMPITLPATSPFYPQGLGLSGDLVGIRYRTVPLGPRINQSLSQNERALVGLKGVLAGWDYDAAFVFNKSNATSEYASGYVSVNRIMDAFSSGLINPFGDSGPAGDALLRSTEVRGRSRLATGITRGIDARASREIVALAAGPLAVALGVEARRESLTDVIEDIAFDTVGGVSRPPTSGTRSVEAAFTEFSVPIQRGLDAQLALRADRYSDFGTTVNPKVSLRWQPVRALLLRGAYGRGFRAPSLPELFTAQTTALFPTGLFGGDPVRCPVTGLDSDCDNLINARFGGNPKLKPERSEQASAGIVFEPVSGVSASVDFWKIRLSNTIQVLAPDFVFDNAATYEGKNIIRGPVDPAFPSLPGPITELVTLNENFGTTRTRGIDIELAYRSNLTPFGRFSARLNGTYIQEFKIQPAGADAANFRAAYVNAFVAPRWQHYLALGWEFGSWNMTLGETLQSGYADARPDVNGKSRHVGNYEVWDAQVAYSGFKNVNLAAGVKNQFDRAPPFSNQLYNFQLGYNPMIADPRGRFWYVRVAVRFR